MQLGTPLEVEPDLPTAESGRWQNQNIDMPAAEDKHQLDVAKDHFIKRNGIEFAGTHLLLDLGEALSHDHGWIPSGIPHNRR